MLLVKAVRKEKAPNPGDCHGIGASSFPFGNIISPCVSIICIRFNGYHLSRFSQHPRDFPFANVMIISESRIKGAILLVYINISAWVEANCVHFVK